MSEFPVAFFGDRIRLRLRCLRLMTPKKFIIPGSVVVFNIAVVPCAVILLFSKGGPRDPVAKLQRTRVSGQPVGKDRRLSPEIQGLVAVDSANQTPVTSQVHDLVQRLTV